MALVVLSTLSVKLVPDLQKYTSFIGVLTRPRSCCSVYRMSKRLSRKPSDVLTRNGFTVREVRRNLRTIFDNALDSDIADGLVWYDEAHQFAVDLSDATGIDLTVVAAVIAALSPQTRWEANKQAAIELLKNDARLPGTLVSNHERAKRVLRSGPMGALAALQLNGDESAPKIASFARNILGDTDRVTVDVWATRGALLSAKRSDLDSEKLLGRAGMYDAIAAQYRYLAEENGITAPQFQAIVWVALTGKNASKVFSHDEPAW